MIQHITQHIVVYAGAAIALALFLRNLRVRLQLSRAKHRSLAGHARMSRRMALLIPHYEYDEVQFFSADGAPAEVASQRRTGFMRLSALHTERYGHTAYLTDHVESGISDLQFTSHYRVPFQFSRITRQHLRPGAFVTESRGTRITDLDGNEFYDLTGAYGVNVFSYDFYKECIERGVEQVRKLGPVLGPYHPVIADNIERLRDISGLDEVSFHMSGTEAVMQAVRLARYHTGRTHVVRFCGAYHGWWGDVQPGVGNPIAARETYTLSDMSEQALRVLASRSDIACVLVNPLQALHPNTAAPGDSTLVDSARATHFDRPAYTQWLQRLREVCTRRGIVLIFDEIFVGFRIARRGAQEYFNLRADMVTYGKTLGGGLPVGVLCGRAALMKRFRDDRPADICFARGTFNSHPYVMATMNEFLQRLDTPAIRDHYTNLDATWDERAQQLNARLQAAGVPVQVANFSSIWTIVYTQPSRYNWMFQFYLRSAGVALSWVGSGRLIFSLNYSDEDFAAVSERIVTAAQAMQSEGWWWRHHSLTNRSIRRQISKEILRALLARWTGRHGRGNVRRADDASSGPSVPLEAGTAAPCDTA